MEYDKNLSNQTVQTAKNMLSSPLFLTGVTAYSVYGVFQVLGGLAGGSSVNSLLNHLAGMGNEYGAGYGYMFGYLGAYNVARVLFTLISSLPALCIIAGMWMMFAAAKKNTVWKVNHAGLKMIKVITMIQLIFTCLGLLLTLAGALFTLVGMADRDSYGFGNALGAISIVVLFILGATLALDVVFYAKLFSTINAMQGTLESGIPNARISRYVEVFCYLKGGTAALSALTSLVGMSLYGFAGSAGLAVSNIVFAIYQRKYRNNMENLRRMQVQPQPQVPPQPQGAPQPQPQVPPQPQVAPQPQPKPQIPPQPEIPYYNETSVLSGQLVNGNQVQLVRMTRQRTGETFCISKPTFWMGKEAANVDYCITNNNAVSRRHLLVTLVNGKCYIRDNRSTNRVFVNGQMIEPDRDVLVSDGDRMKLADEEFIVHIS